MIFDYDNTNELHEINTENLSTRERASILIIALTNACIELNKQLGKKHELLDININTMYELIFEEILDFKLGAIREAAKPYFDKRMELTKKQKDILWQQGNADRNCLIDDITTFKMSCFVVFTELLNRGAEFLPREIVRQLLIETLFEDVDILDLKLEDDTVSAKPKLEILKQKQCQTIIEKEIQKLENKHTKYN